MKTNRLHKIISIFITFCFALSLNAAPKKQNNKAQPLNISVFIDLSDRLDNNNLKHSQVERDLDIVDYLADIFIKDCQTNGKIVNSKNHFQVLVYPAPTDSKISALADNLEVDLSVASIKEKRQLLIGMSSLIKDNLKQIYNDVISRQQWLGCDIWGFFSYKDVDVQCVRKGYRNILVILTDGYIYHQDNKQQKGNAYSYILSKTLTNQNSSLIVDRDGLDDLEVLVLEVNPTNPKQRTQIEKIIRDWLGAMGIKHFDIGVTDIFSRTQKRIDNFF